MKKNGFRTRLFGFRKKDVLAEIARLSSGTAVKFNYGGNNCHLFNMETGINLEA